MSIDSLSILREVAPHQHPGLACRNVVTVVVVMVTQHHSLVGAVTSVRSETEMHHEIDQFQSDTSVAG